MAVALLNLLDRHEGEVASFALLLLFFYHSLKRG